MRQTLFVLSPRKFAWLGLTAFGAVVQGRNPAAGFAAVFASLLIGMVQLWPVSVVTTESGFEIGRAGVRWRKRLITSADILRYAHSLGDLRGTAHLEVVAVDGSVWRPSGVTGGMLWRPLPPLGEKPAKSGVHVGGIRAALTLVQDVARQPIDTSEASWTKPVG